MAFSAVPSPLYGLYRARDHFSVFMVTVVYAVYAVGVLIVWRHYTILRADSWYAAPSAAAATLSRAGHQLQLRSGTTLPFTVPQLQLVPGTRRCREPSTAQVRKYTHNGNERPGGPGRSLH